MVDHAGEILVAPTLVLFSFLSYLLVWALNGPRQGAEPQSEDGQDKRASEPRM
jgi:hypothetical protein